MKPILGIDPGISGGIAFFDPLKNTIDAFDIPNVNGEVDGDAVMVVLRQWDPGEGVIERVGAMPKQGVSSTFKFGQAAGMLKMAIISMSIPLHPVSPMKWKKHFGLPAEKEAARALAIRLWPGVGYFSRKKDHGRAEASLIALWRWQTSGGVASSLLG